MNFNLGKKKENAIDVDDALEIIKEEKAFDRAQKRLKQRSSEEDEKFHAATIEVFQINLFENYLL